MIQVNTKMIKNTLLLSLSGLLLASCNFGGEPSSLVSEYSQKRWDALISGNLQIAYQYYSDSYKKTVPYEHFPHKIKGVGLWSKAKVVQVVCEKKGKKCEAEVKVTVAMRMRGLSKPSEVSDTVKETWINSGNFSDWRYVSE